VVLDAIAQAKAEPETDATATTAEATTAPEEVVPVVE